MMFLCLMVMGVICLFGCLNLLLSFVAFMFKPREWLTACGLFGIGIVTLVLLAQCVSWMQSAFP